MHDHYAHFSHDVINRCLSDEKLTSQLIFENVFSQIYLSQNGYVIFDESVLDKNFSVQVELLRRQYSSNVHAIIKGSGLIDCLYINPESGDYWIINYRIFDPDGDGKTKLDHVQDMLTHAIAEKKLSFTTVLMDTWYATKDLMLFIESVDKIYYCPLRNNRLVDDSGAAAPYQHVSALQWTQQEQSQGKTIKIKGFPKQHKVKLFRVVVSTNRTDWVVTNDLAQDIHGCDRTGVSHALENRAVSPRTQVIDGCEKYQCRKARIQHNHIACTMLVWVRLMKVARKTKKIIYQVKHGLMGNYLR